MTNPLNKQIQGSHYKDRAIQPIEFILANDLGFCEGNVVKYVTRWKDKNGVEDLRKAIHYLEFLIDKEEKKNRESGTVGGRDDQGSVSKYCGGGQWGGASYPYAIIQHDDGESRPEYIVFDSTNTCK